MFHTTVENASFERFDELLQVIETRFGQPAGKQVQLGQSGWWHSLYRRRLPSGALFCQRLKALCWRRYAVAGYLEPGESSAITQF